MIKVAKMYTPSRLSTFAFLLRTLSPSEMRREKEKYDFISFQSGICRKSKLEKGGASTVSDGDERVQETLR